MKVYAYGDNTAGNLLPGGATTLAQFTEILDETVVNVTASLAGVLVINAAGKAKVNGANTAQKQLCTSSAAPAWEELAVTDVIGASFGTNHALVLTNTTVYGCGDNSLGQLINVTDANNHVLTNLSAYFPENITQVGAVSDVSYFVGTKNIFVVGDCPFCRLDGGYKFLNLPCRFGDIHKIQFFVNNFIIQDIYMTIFLFGYNPCDTSSTPDSITALPVSYTQSISMSSTVMSIVQNGKLITCGIQTTDNTLFTGITKGSSTLYWENRVTAVTDAVVLGSLVVVKDANLELLDKTTLTTLTMTETDTYYLFAVEGVGAFLITTDADIPYFYTSEYVNPDPADGEVFTAGLNHELRGGSTGTFSELTNQAFKKVVAGTNVTLAIGSDDLLYGMGVNTFGQMALPYHYIATEFEVNPFFQDQDHAVIDIAVDGLNGIIATVDDRIFVFGDNQHSQLGILLNKDTNTANSLVNGPQEIDLYFMAYNEFVQSVHVVGEMFYIQTNATLWAFGYESGVINNGGNMLSGPIVPVPLVLPFVFTELMKVESFETALTIVRLNGDVYTFGESQNFELCKETSANIEFEKVELTGIDYFFIGQTRSLFVSGNELYYCGQNNYVEQQMGVNSTGSSQKYHINAYQMTFAHGTIEAVAVDDDLLEVLTTSGLYVMGEHEKGELYGVPTLLVEDWTKVLTQTETQLLTKIFANNDQTFILANAVNTAISSSTGAVNDEVEADILMQAVVDLLTQ